MSENVKMKRPTVELHLPGSLFPMATSNAMLIIGATKTGCECDFPLHYFLIACGGIGLTLLVMEGFSNYVVKWVLEDGRVTPIENKVLNIVKILGYFLTLVELAIFITGSTIVFHAYEYVQYEPMYPENRNCTYRTKFDSLLPYHTHGIYCDYSLFMFTFCLVIMTWIGLIFGFLCFAYILFGRRNVNE